MKKPKLIVINIGYSGETAYVYFSEHNHIQRQRSTLYKIEKKTDREIILKRKKETIYYNL